jgi:hypothetical protein
MLLSRHQNVGQNRDIKIANRSFENVSQPKYLGTTVKNQNLIQEEIKRRLNSGNACYHSVQNLLFSRLLLKNLKIRIYKTIILPVVLYGCETWSLTLREEHIFGPKRDEVREDGENCIMRSFVICTLRQAKLEWSSSGRCEWAWHIGRIGEKRNTYGLLLGKPEGKRPQGRPGHRQVNNIKMEFGEIGCCDVD